MTRPKANEMLAALTAYKRAFFNIGLFSAVINLLMLAPALYMLQVYDRVLASGNQMTLLMLTLMILGLFGLMGALEWVRSQVVIRLGTQMDMRLNQRVYDAAFEAQLRTGSPAAAQALNDLTSLRQFATGNALFAFFDAPWFPVYLFVIFMFSPWLGLLALGGAVLLILLAWVNQHVSQAPLKAASELSVQATQQASAHLRNAEAIEAMGMLDTLRGRWLAQHTAFLAQQNLASEKTATVSAWSKGVRLALQSLVLGLGALLAVQGQITAGMMIAGSILMGRVLSPIDQLIGVWKQWSSARLAYQRLEALLHSYPARAQRMALPAPRGELAVEQLSASAPGTRRATLANLSFTLPAGQVLGVIGPSGCGKSTLARLLIGVWQPLAGKVRLDGAELSQWDKHQLGPHLGYLPQDIQLFAGTIAQNIARFAEVDADKVLAAAQLAGVHQLILQLPEGYETRLGEGGAGLSGGQKQRIGLARALYGLPAVIVLDEPNSNLDEAGEQALLQAIAQLKQHKRTLILITHKPNVLTLTDQLLILREGQLQAFGPTAKVLGAPVAAKPAAPKTAMNVSYRLGTAEANKA
ncbi:type I secretion system permease/ATPase [Pseudomonas fragi]|jgi:ATP-binding cassette, subfamily C, bacterial exporter for protease/lipase|uniref:Type I secretion system permease/ATPase n=1 Tax=Pseudomonas fragi TaxID=296 RepID=A0A9Q5AXX2_PSEFR|nr:type I secretion system permease/ATPase [Pseudomonas fragi]MBM1200779.1 type I secretion system permease/ATPase [Pseudomonas fragi]NNB24942.1 type I secretion system permease/ATPase [Pseudomonas fragi]NNB34944.1 type I secretion system permease/ATPase [Pseudomonas fragi]NNB48630.1 type I secretion system permease/ATPase [Pseudomonas fragi]PAA10630.1 type I secretion system permease/ATPase [Pseudomonas fragi]